jgi:fucose 4-O-acetylase-like acetyltransferase
MKRLIYIDNIRILLTALVVLHHLAISYGAPGLWYYNEPNSNELSTIFLSLFVATNQSFFMGMFFMISAYFLERSIAKKSPTVLLKGKLKRLGLPLIFYALIIAPIISCLLYFFENGNIPTFEQFLMRHNWLTLGPMWFLEALLLFIFFRLLLYKPNQSTIKTIEKLSNIHIIALILLISGLTFLVRIYFPVSHTIPLFGFQLAHFPQYILLFYIGLKAVHLNLFELINYKQSKAWIIPILFMIFVAFPLVFYFGGALTKGPEIFMGGFSLQSLIYIIWEQAVGIGIIVILLGLFKAKFNYQNSLLKEASKSAYGVYILHSLILVLFALLIKDLAIAASLKFLILVIPSLMMSFFLASRLRRVRGFDVFL